MPEWAAILTGSRDNLDENASHLDCRAATYRVIAEVRFGTKHSPEHACKSQSAQSDGSSLAKSICADARTLPANVAAIALREVAHRSRGVSKIHPLMFGIPLRASAPPS